MDWETIYTVELEGSDHVVGHVEYMELRNSAGEPTVWHLAIYDPASRKLVRRVRADRVVDQWIELNTVEFA